MLLVKYLDSCNMLCLFMQHECFFSILTIQISVQVTFVVRELKQIAAAVNGTVGTNNECLVVASARAPNILGRGEKLEGEISLGNKQTKNYNITLSKPIHPKYRARYVSLSLVLTIIILILVLISVSKLPQFLMNGWGL